MTILVTGGAGFIGSNFILDWLKYHDEMIINLDKLTYAGHLESLASIQKHPSYLFVQGDIADSPLVLKLLTTYDVRAVIHFAAESHVDRSIHHADTFIQTNIVGTFKLLEAVRSYWNEGQRMFRFFHISTDEVFGTLQENDAPFKETTPYQPNSPYAASKASSDHLVRSFHHTYGLPVVSSNCSNNYGPYQHPEKLIPLCIYRALRNEPIPIYGSGSQIRDWLHVIDHCHAIRCILHEGGNGEQYNIGGGNERTNLEVVKTICSILDKKLPRSDGVSYIEQITHVQDRLGHDFRYAIDASKIHQHLTWKPLYTFESGIEETIEWYLEHQDWVQRSWGRI